MDRCIARQVDLWSADASNGKTFTTAVKVFFHVRTICGGIPLNFKKWRKYD